MRSASEREQYNSMKNYYDILGITKNASEDEIKKAFRSLAHKYHPDKKGGDEAKFKEVSEAYAVLSDKKRRAEYDAYGRTFNGTGAGGFDFSGFADAFRGFENGQGGVEFDIGDIFGEFFGGGTGRRQRRGRDISIDLEIPFKESVFGTERRVLVAKQGTCSTCSGSGAKAGTQLTTCAACNGKGQIHETRNSFFGSFTSMRACPTCGGRGEIPKEPCTSCRGAGVRKQEDEIHVTVPPGMDDGEMIRMPGRGEAVQAGTPGDLYVKIHVKTDKAFSREGANLLTELRIKLTDALLGHDTTIESLDGPVTLSIPAGVEHGSVLRVRGKGVPVRSGRGDLLVRITVDLPKKLSKEAKKLIQGLQAEGL